MDADDVAGQLYGLPPEEFTAARDEHAAQARAAGDKAVASAIAKLRRPTAAAWLANLLVRAHPAEVERLGTVGESLRQAQRELSGVQLRELAGVRRQTIRALADQARSLARAAGHPPSDAAMQQLEDTLSAALADAAFAAQLREGRLTVALSYSGFGGVGVGAFGTDPAESDRRTTAQPGQRAGVVRATETRPVADQPMATDQAAAERAGDEAVAGGEKSERAAAEREAAEREAAEREAAEREAAEREVAEREAAEREAVEQTVADAETTAASAADALRAARAECATAENAASRAEQAAQALRAEVIRAEREATQAGEAVGRAARQARAAERARQRAEDALDRACQALTELERGQARSGRR